MNGVQLINGYKWVDTHYNGKKIAGSKLIDVSGETLGVNNTYDDAAYITIKGKTLEIGTGEKSPDNPYTLQSVGSDGEWGLVSSGENLFNSDEPYKGVTIPFDVTLGGLPDGTADYILIDNVEKRTWFKPSIAKEIFKGSGTDIWTSGGNFYLNSQYSRFIFNLSTNAIGQSNDSIHLISDKFNSVAWDNGVARDSSNNIHTYSGDKRIGFTISNDIIGITASDDATTRLGKVNAWLAENPITILHKPTAPPAPTQLDYKPVKTYYPYTQIYTTGATTPTLDGKIRIYEEGIV